MAGEALVLAWPLAGEADGVAAEAEEQLAVEVIPVEAGGARAGAETRLAASRTIRAQPIRSHRVRAARAGRNAGPLVQQGASRALDAVGLIEAGLAGVGALLAGEVGLEVEVEVRAGDVACGGCDEVVVERSAERAGVGEAGCAKQAGWVAGLAQLADVVVVSAVDALTGGCAGHEFPQSCGVADHAA